MMRGRGGGVQEVESRASIYSTWRHRHCKFKALFILFESLHRYGAQLRLGLNSAQGGAHYPPSPSGGRPPRGPPTDLELDIYPFFSQFDYRKWPHVKCGTEKKAVAPSLFRRWGCRDAEPFFHCKIRGPNVTTGRLLFFIFSL